MRVHFTHLGCKLNQAEVDHLARQFVAAGHDLVAELRDADLHVINSCTVTEQAARDSRKAARRGRRLNPTQKTVLTGCHATAEPQAARQLLGVDLVVENRHKAELLPLVHAAFPQLVPTADPLPVPYVPIEFGHTRGLVKVEDGCNMRCAFCIIPQTRGPQQSRPRQEVVAEVQMLVASGYREVVVTGVQISEYRDNTTRLYDLVQALLAETAVERLRLTSIAPWRFDARLLTLLADPRLCRHFHLSLQSGADATLLRMRRPYTTAQFRALCDQIRTAVPGVAITTDVIVGFPGETTQEFATSLDFVTELQLARPHVFAFSPRPGTAAHALPDHVPKAEVRARMAAMLAVAADSERRFWSHQLGTTLAVLWERQKRGEFWSGLSDNYVRVLTRSDHDLGGRLAPAQLTALGRAGVYGSVPHPEVPVLLPTGSDRAFVHG